MVSLIEIEESKFVRSFLVRKNVRIKLLFIEMRGFYKELFWGEI